MHQRRKGLTDVVTGQHASESQLAQWTRLAPWVAAARRLPRLLDTLDGAALFAALTGGSVVAHPGPGGQLDKSAVLDRFGLFRHATTEMRSAVESAGRPLILPPGAFLFRDGDSCEQFTLVGRGSVRVFRTGGTGREITLYHVQAGESCLMNTLSVVLGTPARATATVEAPLEALAFPRPVFLEWLRTSDAVRSFILETMAQRLVDVMTLVEEIAFGKMDLRLAHLLCRRFANNGVPLSTISTTHEEIAAGAGDRSRGREPAAQGIRATACPRNRSRPHPAPGRGRLASAPTTGGERGGVEHASPDLRDRAARALHPARTGNPGSVTKSRNLGRIWSLMAVRGLDVAVGVHSQEGQMAALRRSSRWVPILTLAILLAPPGAAKPAQGSHRHHSTQR